MKKWFGAAAALFFCLSVPVMAYGAEGDGAEGDFSQVQEFLDSQETGITFGDLLEELKSGDWERIPELILQRAGQQLFSELRKNRQELAYLFALAAASGVFTAFSSFFALGQVAQTGFYLTYLLVAATLLAAFSATAGIAETLAGTVLSFMGLLLPPFFLAVTYAGGSLTSAAFYQTTLLAIGGVEWLFLRILFPFAKIYLLLALVNEIVGEDLLSRMAKLVKAGTGWGMKILFSMVIGLQLIQGIILPYVDSVKASAVKKAVGLIPGVGKGLDAAAEILMGSGVLIKNGIGTAAMLCLFLLGLAPVVKLAVITCMYRGAAALLAPVADKRLIRCIDAMAEATGVLLKLSVMILALFAVSLALVCGVTNGRFLGS